MNNSEDIKKKIDKIRGFMERVNENYQSMRLENHSVSLNRAVYGHDRLVDDSYPCFARYLSIKADRSKQYTGNKNLVEKELMAQLLQSGYRYVAKEFLYHNVFTDFFCMDPMGKYFMEIELKVSRSDFLNDFRKKVDIDGQRSNKHILLSMGELFIHKFYFLVPDRMIAPSEIPGHCGLIYFQELGADIRFRVIKRCPILHNNPAPDGIWKHIADRVFSQLKSCRRKASGNLIHNRSTITTSL